MQESNKPENAVNEIVEIAQQVAGHEQALKTRDEKKKQKRRDRSSPPQHC